MSSPAPLPFLPPSPVEEDISRAGAWTEERISGGSSGSTARRGKEKEAAQGTSHGEEGDEDDFEEDDPGVDEYPPTKDEEAEARRIEEVSLALIVAEMSFAACYNYVLISRTYGAGKSLSESGGKPLASPQHLGVAAALRSLLTLHEEQVFFGQVVAQTK